MTTKELNKNKIRIDISRTILAILLFFGIYTFFNKEPVAAKLLAMGGSIGFLFLLIMSFRSLSTSNN
ncbi:hypothetical protein [Lentibacillus juripiscarius]|uniref:Uncharacterized protein n=1 Tax=Lentibacillus juripiscarius TaxID=257446 RepID=A0ABW5V7L6_9BACI